MFRLRIPGETTLCVYRINIIDFLLKTRECPTPPEPAATLTQILRCHGVLPWPTSTIVSLTAAARERASGTTATVPPRVAEIIITLALTLAHVVLLVPLLHVTFIPYAVNLTTFPALQFDQFNKKAYETEPSRFLHLQVSLCAKVKSEDLLQKLSSFLKCLNIYCINFSFLS